MSAVTEVLARRPVAWAPVTGDEACLAYLRRGQQGVVTGIDESGSPATARRLMDLGFAPGAVVEFVRRTPLGDPLIFRVADYDIALRRSLARQVRIMTLPAGGSGR